MFEYASAFNGDLSGFNTSAVTDMSRMFYGAAAFNGDLSGFDTSAVIDKMDMFSGATAYNAADSNTANRRSAWWRCCIQQLNSS